MEDLTPRTSMSSVYVYFIWDRKYPYLCLAVHARMYTGRPKKPHSNIEAKNLKSNV